MKLLLVEDDPKAAAVLKKGLCENGFVVDAAGDGDDGLALARTGVYDLVILDVMLPGRDGWAVLTELKRSGVTSPVLFLSARDAVEDRVNVTVPADSLMSVLSDQPKGPQTIEGGGRTREMEVRRNEVWLTIGGPDAAVGLDDLFDAVAGATPST